MKFSILISGGVLFLGGFKSISMVDTEVSISFYMGLLWIILGVLFIYVALLNNGETK